jgi:hypothetical protein
MCGRAAEANAMEVIVSLSDDELGAEQFDPMALKRIPRSIALHRCGDVGRDRTSR